MSDLALIQRVLFGVLAGAALAALLVSGNVTLAARVEASSSAVDVLAALLAILLFGVTLIVTVLQGNRFTGARGDFVNQVIRSFFMAFRVVLLAAGTVLAYRVAAAELADRSEVAEAAAFALASGAFGASFACAWALARTTYELAKRDLVADADNR